MSYKITSFFSQKESFRSKGHTGIDFSMQNGTELRSIENGKIVDIVDYGSKNIGKGVLVQWENGKTAIYGHMSKVAPNLKEGDTVATGDLLGYSGNSGHVVGVNGGYHLHFGLKENGHFIDPSLYIDKIQHMNEPIKQIVKSGINNATQTKVDFFYLYNQHIEMLSSILSELKLQFVNFAILSDYSPIIQLLENVVKFLFVHI